MGTCIIQPQQPILYLINQMIHKFLDSFIKTAPGSPSFRVVFVQRQITRNFQAGRLKHVSPMHLSDLYPQWGDVDPRRCHWSCITSSCTCHPTKIAPSMAYHNVATSLTPLNGVIDAPSLWRTFSHTPIWGHHFGEQGLHVRPYFGAKTHFRQTFCTIHQFLLNCDNFQYLSLAVMATNNPEAEEVSRVNNLLQIEDLVWTRQLKKAVSV